MFHSLKTDQNTMALKRMLSRPGAQQRPGINSPAYFGKKPTPQDKIVNVVDKLGIPGLKNQQGTTRTIYHFLPLTEGTLPETNYPFFRNVKQAAFPYTNINENKLQAGEALAVQRIYFAILTVTTATGVLVDIDTFDSFATPAFYLSSWNLKIGSQDYTKDNTLMAFKPEYNKHALHTSYNVYHAGVETVIPPDIQFYLNVDAPPMTIPSSETLSFYIGCFLEGDGSILNMKTNL